MQNEFINLHTDNDTARQANGEIVDTSTHAEFLLDVAITYIIESRNA